VKNQIEVMVVAKYLDTAIFIKDEIIIHQGDEAFDLYIMFQGTCSVLQQK